MIGAALQAHLDSGCTTLARCWRVTRKDGVSFGFTDHDRDLSFEGVTFRAGTGLSASALEQATGLSVDNAEALGALTEAALTEEDIALGRFDAADVTCWLVNWVVPDQRHVLFGGFLGEIAREGGAFRAELRGLGDLLNRPTGRVFQGPCSAVLGDAACQVDTADPAYFWEGPLLGAERGLVLRLPALVAFEEGWFVRGHLKVLSGRAEGVSAIVRRDLSGAEDRELVLWEEIPVPLSTGDRVRVVAGCDKRFDTCRAKFANVLNFQGFPDVPDDDWIAVYPASGVALGGGSRR